jgi:hypothetical protein
MRRHWLANSSGPKQERHWCHTPAAQPLQRALGQQTSRVNPTYQLLAGKGPDQGGAAAAAVCIRPPGSSDGADCVFVGCACTHGMGCIWCGVVCCRLCCRLCCVRCVECVWCLPLVRVVNLSNLSVLRQWSCQPGCASLGMQTRHRMCEVYWPPSCSFLSALVLRWVLARPNPHQRECSTRVPPHAARCMVPAMQRVHELNRRQAGAVCMHSQGGPGRHHALLHTRWNQV